MPIQAADGVFADTNVWVNVALLRLRSMPRLLQPSAGQASEPNGRVARWSGSFWP